MMKRSTQPTDEEAAAEEGVQLITNPRIASLQSRTSSRSSSFLIVGEEQQPQQQQQQQQQRSPSSSTLLLQLVLSIALYLAGWQIPRYLIDTETSIVHRQVPYQVTAAGDVILDSELNQPLTDPPTIPSSFLVWTSVGLPILLVLAVSWLSTSPSSASPTTSSSSSSSAAASAASIMSGNPYRVHLLHASFCGLLTAIGLSEGSTQLLKLYVQRRRPNFYAFCGFDKTLKTCMGPLDHIRDANFSFPSGHSSLAASGMTFLVWFFLARTIGSNAAGGSCSSWLANNHRYNKRWIALLACLLPWAWAVFVGASRLVDGWHHPSDVLAGLCLGGLTSTIAYHVWFPPVWISSQPWSLIAWNTRGGSGVGISASGSFGGDQSSSKLPSFAE